eukprot:353928-Chlamydomonas_euryale.AAC.6
MPTCTRQSRSLTTERSPDPLGTAALAFDWARRRGRASTLNGRARLQRNTCSATPAAPQLYTGFSRSCM